MQVVGLEQGFDLACSGVGQQPARVATPARGADDPNRTFVDSVKAAELLAYLLGGFAAARSVAAQVLLWL